MYVRIDMVHVYHSLGSWRFCSEFVAIVQTSWSAEEWKTSASSDTISSQLQKFPLLYLCLANQCQEKEAGQALLQKPHQLKNKRDATLLVCQLMIFVSTMLVIFQLWLTFRNCVKGYTKVLSINCSVWFYCREKLFFKIS